MKQNHIDYLQTTTKTFLKVQMLNMVNFNVLNVMVTNQSDTTRPHRRLDSRSSLDVAITITGDYKPPVFVDYDTVIIDAMNTGSELLANDLRINGETPVFVKSGGAEYFASLQSVHSRFTNETQVSSPRGNSNELQWWVPTLCVSLTVALMVGGCIVWKEIRSRKTHLTEEIKK